ncbi:MAG: hypothetical protein ABIE03_03660 [Patescibacteria group bacterium]|nr:hypothetical protein [Patescibacteria group bacterium]
MKKLIVDKNIFFKCFYPCLAISVIFFPIGVSCGIMSQMSMHPDAHDLDWLYLLFIFSAIPVFAIGAIFQFLKLKRKGVQKRDYIKQTVVFAILPIFVILVFVGFCWVYDIFISQLSALYTKLY